MRPRGEAIRKPRHNMIIRGKGTPGGLAGAYQGEAKAFSRGRAEPAPPRGDDPGKMALRGKPPDDAKGGFLGGMRSARPHSKAVRMPKHCIPTRCLGERAGGLAGICLGQAGAFFSGRAEPAPPRGGQRITDGLAEEGPGMAREAVFSEGRGLRVREARPDARRGIT